MKKKDLDFDVTPGCFWTMLAIAILIPVTCWLIVYFVAFHFIAKFW